MRVLSPAGSQFSCNFLKYVILISGTIPTLGVARFLSSTWQRNICGPGGHGHWPYLLLLGRHSAAAKGRPENIEDTKVPVSSFITLYCMANKAKQKYIRISKRKCLPTPTGNRREVLNVQEWHFFNTPGSVIVDRISDQLPYIC